MVTTNVRVTYSPTRGRRGRCRGRGMGQKWPSTCGFPRIVTGRRTRSGDRRPIAAPWRRRAGGMSRRCSPTATCPRSTASGVRPSMRWSSSWRRDAPSACWRGRSTGSVGEPPMSCPWSIAFAVRVGSSRRATDWTPRRRSASRSCRSHPSSPNSNPRTPARGPGGPSWMRPGKVVRPEAVVVRSATPRTGCPLSRPRPRPSRRLPPMCSPEVPSVRSPGCGTTLG